MQSLAIIGAQWGDEGKGKITDLLGAKADLVVRYQGGNNAGHTIIVGDKKIVLHLIPSGILHPHVLSIVGHGVVFDPGAFLDELVKLDNYGLKVTRDNLAISENCTVITSYHRLIDTLRESNGLRKIGTTGRGIGPAYEDKAGRRGIKLRDIVHRDLLKQRLAECLAEKEVLFKHHYHSPFPSLEDETNRLYEMGHKLSPFLCDTFGLIDQCLQNNKKILFEGAQGVLLDVDYGSYPYVTSSNTSFGGIFTGAGHPNRPIDEVIGVAKAYTTRVGEGPFPTELKDGVGEKIQTVGKEFGATTGRKRRCGWLDIPLLRYSIKASNLTSIALTKLDVLTCLDELKLCYAYRYHGKELDCAYPGIDLSEVEPLYKSMPVFRDDFQTNKTSHEFETYVRTIEEMVGIPIGILAFGPERNQIIFRKAYF
ncbi:MAG: adenylosuccinate synthase [Bdellovibrionales bacterium GWA2_49_15]|nr:MAG: adenylosuccinate synthase [Bdellovibrionales bacterium GWA2_49_15]HAZ15026.1 adenylosuccinate synthase [Bdellovibrionales bacterium]